MSRLQVQDSTRRRGLSSGGGGKKEGGEEGRGGRAAPSLGVGQPPKGSIGQKGVSPPISLFPLPFPLPLPVLPWVQEEGFWPLPPFPLPLPFPPLLPCGQAGGVPAC